MPRKTIAAVVEHAQRANVDRAIDDEIHAERADERLIARRSARDDVGRRARTLTGDEAISKPMPPAAGVHSASSKSAPVQVWPIAALISAVGTRYVLGVDSSER